LIQNESIAVRTAVFSIVGNFLMALTKWLAGFFGNSYALIADAIESTTDVLSSALVLFGLKYASKPADVNHPYGHGRIEPLITFIVVGFLIFSSLVIGYHSILNIQTPHAQPKYWTLFVLGGIIVWKELSYRFVIRKAKLTQSSTLKADAWHHRSDAITSVTAFIGICIARICGEGYESADDWAALFATGFILYNAYKIFRPALGEMMDEHLHDELVQKIDILSKEVEGVHNTEKCRIRKIGMRFFVDIHIRVDGQLSVREGHDISHAFKAHIQREIPSIENMHIHIEPFQMVPLHK
jgi:cation diffusion facilitator family transporter